MSKIAPSFLPPMHVARQPVKSDSKSEDSRVSRRSNSHEGKSSLASALEMADDLSILKTSLRRRRDGEGESVSSEAWVDHVLEEHAEEKYIQLKSVLAQGRDTLAAFRSMLGQLFPDSSDMVSVLQALLADEETAAELRSELEALLASLKEGGSARATRAGVNVAIKAKLSSRRTGLDAKNLRSAYRRFLERELTITSLYELWIEQYGFEHRFNVVDFVENALAADMYALDPSCSRIEFGQLLQSSRSLATLRSSDNTILKHCWIESIMHRIAVEPAELMRSILDIVRNGGGLPALLLTSWSSGKFAWKTTEKSQLAQGLRRALKTIPHDLWLDVSFQHSALEEIDLWCARTMKMEFAGQPHHRSVMA
jgi:type III secretion system protein